MEEIIHRRTHESCPRHQPKLSLFLYLIRYGHTHCRHFSVKIMLNSKTKKSSGSTLKKRSRKSRLHQLFFSMTMRGRSGQGSLPCSKLLRSHAGTSLWSRHMRRLPPKLEVESLNQRLNRHVCLSI